MFSLLLWGRVGGEGLREIEGEKEREKENCFGFVYNVVVLKSLFNIFEFLKRYYYVILK